MKFVIITHASHKRKENNIFSYEPYVREMNLWTPHASEIRIVAPITAAVITNIDTNYHHQNIQIIPIAAFDVLTLKNTLKTIVMLPKTAHEIYKTMVWADHIHLRCPGNIGLIGCFVQLVFPNKPKTAKYAGNWDPKAKQPWSYRLQKWLLSNTFLTKNMKVLVYGEWENQSKNIVPFFTASYSEMETGNRHPEHRHPEPACRQAGSFQDLMNCGSNVDCSSTLTDAEIEDSRTPLKTIKKNSEQTGLPAGRQVQQDGMLNFIFVGALTKGKQPLLSVEVIRSLKEKGHRVHLDIYGEGPERSALTQYIALNELGNEVQLHGNCDKETIKKGYQNAHFLLFISQFCCFLSVFVNLLCRFSSPFLLFFKGVRESPLSI